MFEGSVPQTPPVSMRLDIWHAHAANTGSLPGEIRGMSVEQVEDLLGFCRSARYRTNLRLAFPRERTETFEENGAAVTRWRLPGGTLEKAVRRTREEELAGMLGQTVKYPVANEADCRILLDALPDAALEADFEGFGELCRRTGDAGLPMLILGPCPLGLLMTGLMGYENFFYALADCPGLVDGLLGALEEKFREQAWPGAFASGAELILHGAHFSDAATPPPLFEKYILPYFRRFNREAHSAGARVLWHADAAMRLLLKGVLEAGFDGADCLATAPLVPQTIEECWNAWGGRIVCWGGLPGTVFQPEFPEDGFRKHLARLREFALGRRGIIIGASDNVMPGALWERILAVRDAFASPGSARNVER